MKKYIPQQKTTIAVSVAAALIILLALCCSIISSPNDTDQPKVIYVYTSDTPAQVKEKVGAGIGWNLLSLIGYHTRAGRYEIQPGEPLWRVFRTLRNGQQSPIRLTIPKLRTLDDIAGFLSHHLMMDSTQLSRQFHSKTFCHQYGYTPETLPALFIPNTYEVWWDTTLPHFMQRMQKESAAFWTEERQAEAKDIGLSPNEVITLASIVEEETANTAEKPMVAGMYMKRLQIDMPLQADPTVKYAVGDFTLRRIYEKHTRTQSPYNTYLNHGLPPGPICIPSISSIDAVLNYTRHDNIYMCANPDFSGTHVFAKTYAEHLQNARKYSQALNQRGIK